MKSYPKLFIFISILFMGLAPVFSQAAEGEVTVKPVPANAFFVEKLSAKPALPRKKEITVETTYFSVTVAAEGAKITSFRHKDPDNPLKSNVEIVDEEYPFTFDIYLYNRKQETDSQELMKVLPYDLRIEKSGDYTSIVASTNILAHSAGKQISLKLEKIYRFHENMHYWDYYWVIHNPGNEDVYLSELRFIPLKKIGPKPENNTSIEMRNFNAFYLLEDSFTTKASADSGKGMLGCGGAGDKTWEKEETKGSLGYLGMASRFMIMAVQPLTTFEGIVLVHEYYKDMLNLHGMPQALLVPAKSSARHSFLVYAGPKVNRYMEISQEMIGKNPALKEAHPKFYKAFDFGFTAPIRDLIVSILKILYKIVPNYGVGIILFALFFKLIFFPLNQAQAKSMKKLQVLQPKVKEINEKYQNNPQEKQRRIMELYRKNKANPLGGCLPMLIQVPIFIALYSAFSNAYELWGSPFISGWIDDLSKPDTVYSFGEGLPLIGGVNLNLLPIIMVASQFLQTKLTTVSTDKNQQTMMMILPFLMLFFFYSMPSGVVLYWIIFNIFSVVQQLLTKTEAKPVTGK